MVNESEQATDSLGGLSGKAVQALDGAIEGIEGGSSPSLNKQLSTGSGGSGGPVPRGRW